MPETAPASSNYRPDIDSMRAIAVLAVVIFHVFPDLIPGGFVGVDIFFVISGYLISHILLQSLDAGRFSLLAFYCRRVNRIVPALLLVLSASLGAGVFLLLSDELQHLAKHVASGAAFISNFVSLVEVDYFAAQDASKPLLHLWSLSIEEQFYVVWPLLLWLAWKRRWSVPLAAGVLACASFGLNVSLVTESTQAAFFLPQARFWELVLGGVLAGLLRGQGGTLAAARGPGADALAAGGIVLIALAFGLTNALGAFPGWWALLPAVGALLLIAAGPQAWFNRRVLAWPPLVWVGLISYPLYLWHWPVLVFTHIEVGQALPMAVRTAIVGVSLLLAWLTFRWVEAPARSARWRGAKAAFFTCALAGIGALGYWGMKTHGFDGFAFRQTGRNDFANYFNDNAPEHPYYNRMNLSVLYRDECNFYKTRENADGPTGILKNRLPKPAIDSTCYTRDTARRHSVFIWGDSHAQHLNHGLRRNLSPDWQVLQVASSGCLHTTTGVQPSSTNYCDQSNWFAVDSIARARPDVVIVAQCCQHDPKTMARTAVVLQSLGVKKVIFTGPVPHWSPSLPQVLVRQLWLSNPERTYLGRVEKVFAANSALRRDFQPGPNTVFVDLIAFFCSEAGCLTRIGDDRRAGATAWDAAHLTPVASDYLARHLLAPLVTQGVSASP